MGVKLNQLIFYIIIHWFIKYCIGIKVVGNDFSKLNKNPILLISNHNSKLDPFLLTALPYREYKTLIPMHFLTIQKYCDNLFTKYMVLPLGAYPIRKFTLSIEDSIKPTIDKLNGGLNVMFFPEGGLVTKKIDKPKKGFEYLLKEINNVNIIQMKIEGIKTKKSFKVLFQKGITLKFGKIIKHKKNISADELYEGIYRL